MYILPAIDLRNGSCVRLIQGDYSRQINYHDDPVAQARQFEQAGAEWLHVVDLDGAKLGKGYNVDVLKAIRAATNLHIEVGGGIRTDDAVDSLLATGIDRVIIGSKALDDFDWFQQQVNKHPGRIVLGLDARDGKIATHGWTETSDVTVLDMAARVNDWPIAAIVYTDIARDGMLTGPNIPATRELAENCQIPVIASGGVSKLDDIIQLRDLPIEGIITGRALYEQTLDLKDALNAVKNT